MESKGEVGKKSVQRQLRDYLFTFKPGGRNALKSQMYVNSMELSFSGWSVGGREAKTETL